MGAEEIISDISSKIYIELSDVSKKIVDRLVEKLFGKKTSEAEWMIFTTLILLYNEEKRGVLSGMLRDIVEELESREKSKRFRVRRVGMRYF